MALPAAATWAGSSGAGSARREAVLRLHRLHFVEKRGTAGVNEIVEERRKQNRNVDAERAKAHAGSIQALRDKHEERIRTGHALTGSMTQRSRAERDAWEEARTDPGEAVEKKKEHMRQVQQSYHLERAGIKDRVAAMPHKTFMTKEERNAWEDARQDIHEAKAQAESMMSARSESYRMERSAMKQRVGALPNSTRWNKHERAKIEDLRQDPEEAMVRMTGHMKGLALSARDERTAMHQRVSEHPSMSFRAKHELEAWEDKRQDLGEAVENAKKNMRERAQAYKEEKDSMHARVGAQAQKTFWTKSERDAIEDMRHDPDEAREKMTLHMRGLSQTYNEQKRSMTDKVHAIPAMSFRSKEDRDRHDTLRAPQLKAQTAR